MISGTRRTVLYTLTDYIENGKTEDFRGYNSKGLGDGGSKNNVVRVVFDPESEFTWTLRGTR